MNSVDISIVVPAFNEAKALPVLHNALCLVLEPLGISYQLIIINDGSTDDTEKVLKLLSEQDACVQAINLARNFGKEAAMAAGLALAKGQCVIFMDADLQHPPEVIPKLYAAWKDGFDVVNAVKRKRSIESFYYRFFAGCFNSLMSTFIGQDMAGASDFKLIDRQVADVLLACPERNRFFRGLVAWVGFRVTKVEFDVGEREHGISKWSLMSLFKYSLNNIVVFSSLPLKIVGYVGFIMAGLGFVLLMQTLVRYAFGTAAIGFTTVISLQILLGGMILTALGVISVYLSKIYDEQKKRPLFIIRNPRVEDIGSNGRIEQHSVLLTEKKLRP